MRFKNNIIIFVIILLLGCSGDFVMSSESDLKKYPEIEIFIYKKQRFYGDMCDIESGTFSFSYSSKEVDSEKILNAIDKRAIKAGWKRLYKRRMECGYSKNLQRYPAQKEHDFIRIEYFPALKRVHVFWGNLGEEKESRINR